jgi:hypothetical protein
MLLVCCNPLQVESQATLAYTDIPGLFQKEAEHLRNIKPGLQKTIIKDSQKESKEIQQPDWEKEFAAFRALDINKPAFVNEYRIDSLIQEGGILLLEYTALSNTLDIQKIRIGFDGSQMVSFMAERKNDNQIYATSQELQYKKGEGYKISGSLSIRFFYSTNYFIESLFLL